MLVCNINEILLVDMENCCVPHYLKSYHYIDQGFQIVPQMPKKNMSTEKITPNIHGPKYGSMRLLRLDQKQRTYLSERPKMRYPTWINRSQQIAINLLTSSERWIKVWTCFRTFKMIISSKNTFSVLATNIHISIQYFQILLTYEWITRLWEVSAYKSWWLPGRRFGTFWWKDAVCTISKLSSVLRLITFYV